LVLRERKDWGIGLHRQGNKEAARLSVGCTDMTGTHMRQKMGRNR
jgi:hypothetical protein